MLTLMNNDLVFHKEFIAFAMLSSWRCCGLNLKLSKEFFKEFVNCLVIYHENLIGFEVMFFVYRSNKSQSLWADKDGQWRSPMKKDNMLQTNMVLYKIFYHLR